MNGIKILIILRRLYTTCLAWCGHIDNKIFLFNVCLMTVPLILTGIGEGAVKILTISIWAVGITISIVFRRISLSESGMKKREG